MRRLCVSLQVRAAIGAAAVVAVALVGAGLAVLAILRADMTTKADQEAAAYGHMVAADLAAGDSSALQARGSGFTVEIVDAYGHPVDPTKTYPGTSRDPGEGQKENDASSGSGGPPPDLMPSPVPTTDPTVGTGLGTGHSVSADTVARSRSAGESTTFHGKRVTVYAAASLSSEETAVKTVRSSMLYGLPALLAVVAATTLLVTRRALGPVEAIQQEMAAITASTDLSRRVPEPASKDAIGRLARTTNTTLAALEASVGRQRQFVADASHELRNPIAALRAQLEVGSAHPQLLDVDEAVEDVARLQHLAADLLLLARLDAGEQPRAGTRVHLSDLIRAHLAQRPPGGVPVRTGPLADLNTLGSGGQLDRVLGNLVDNAQRHAAAQVVVSLRSAAGQAVLRVADDGDGVPEDQRERIFERFVRLDDARSRDDGGAGLGLAIARDVVERHGGTITVSTGPDGGAVFEVRLPLA